MQVKSSQGDSDLSNWKYILVMIKNIVPMQVHLIMVVQDVKT